MDPESKASEHDRYRVVVIHQNGTKSLRAQNVTLGIAKALSLTGSADDQVLIEEQTGIKPAFDLLF